MSNPTILWFRQDLRLSDNPALDHALAQGQAVIPVYVLDPQREAPWAHGGASRWWLHHSLAALDQALAARGNRLHYFVGDSGEVLEQLLRETDAAQVLWNRCYEPAAIAADKQIKQRLNELGAQPQSFNAALWWEPWELATGAGDPYRVFTPMWKRMLKEWRQPQPSSAPAQIPAPSLESVRYRDEVSLAALDLLPRLNWAAGFADHWQPGEDGAQQRLTRFVNEAGGGYKEQRDLPALDGTSGLSPHLHFGEISPRQIVAACCPQGHAPIDPGLMAYVREVAWREFSYHLLYHFPKTTNEPLNPRFSDFPWIEDQSAALARWQRGETGIPLVDAGMRQLWQSGWMHNRVRMVVASFLTKNLLIPWQEGARWFWDTLVDADLANNTQGWQWTAGCGADAAPYFRIFNPVSQGQKFDPEGEYVSRWVPELTRLPTAYRHAPWEASADLLQRCGVKLGHNYPEPMVDLKRSRERALAAYAETKGEST